LSLELQGTRELTAQLLRLGQKTAAKELRGTARAAMKVVDKAWRARMPQHPLPHYTYRGRLVGGGFASRNVRIITKINKQTGSVEAVIGVRREAFYIVQFVERGTSKMPANPTLVPAFTAVQSQALQIITEQLRTRLERAKRKG
jgi:HK97 gp10 family phage protein